jgi:hypothetical protein
MLSTKMNSKRLPKEDLVLTQGGWAWKALRRKQIEGEPPPKEGEQNSYGLK